MSHLGTVAKRRVNPSPGATDALCGQVGITVLSINSTSLTVSLTLIA